MTSLKTAQEPQSIPAATTTQDSDTPVSIINMHPEKWNDTEARVESESLKPLPELVPDLDAQHGIQKIEAVTLSWSKASLAALLIKYVFPQFKFQRFTLVSKQRC